MKFVMRTIWVVLCNELSQIIFSFSADLTDRYIGVGETLLVSSVNGVIFALFAAQPLLIVGATGPLMIFDMSLLQVCFISHSLYIKTLFHLKIHIS